MICRRRIFPIYPFLLGFICTIILPLVSFGQTASAPADIVVYKADLRGIGYEEAGRAAFKASTGNVVIVLLLGAQEDVIACTEMELRVLIYEGYDRVGLLIADEMVEGDEKHPMTLILVNNENPSYMTGVGVHDRYRLDLRRSVQNAYERYIVEPDSN